MVWYFNILKLIFFCQKNGYRKTIKENDTSVDPVLEGIIAEDVDETGNITWSLGVNTMYTASRVFLENGTFSSQYKKLETNSDIKADISKWFKLKVISGETDSRRKEFNLVLGDELPDRDPYGQEDIDQVELIISVNDSNTETGKDAQAVTQLVTITIQDINDNPPQWRDGESDNFIGIITETEFDNEDDDTSSDREREIYTLTGVTDRDRNPTFFFSLRWLINFFGHFVIKLIIPDFQDKMCFSAMTAIAILEKIFAAISVTCLNLVVLSQNLE